MKQSQSRMLFGAAGFKSRCQVCAHCQQREGIMRRSVSRFFIVGTAMLMAAGPVVAQQEDAIDHAMTVEYNVRIPMRDGVRLSADIYRPRGAARHPTIFQLTPYSNNSNGSLEGAASWVKRGYAYVTADVRGRYDSDGEFRPYISDGDDGSDIMDWIAKQPWSNQKVATMGGSYGGKNQWEMAKRNNPHHVAMAPYVAPADEFNDLSRYNGVPKLDLVYTWLMGMDGRVGQASSGWKWGTIMRKLPLVSLDRVNGRNIKVWQDMMEHDKLDEFWAPLQMRGGGYEKFKIPSF